MTTHVDQALALRLLEKTTEGKLWLDPSGQFGLRVSTEVLDSNGLTCSLCNNSDWNYEGITHKTGCPGYSPSDRLEDWQNAVLALPGVAEVHYGRSTVNLLLWSGKKVRVEASGFHGLQLALEALLGEKP